MKVFAPWILFGTLSVAPVWAGQFQVRTETGEIIKHADSAEREAARDEAKGQYASAILIYDQMSQQGKLNDRLLKRMVHCHELLEKQPTIASADKSAEPADDLFQEKESLAAITASSPTAIHNSDIR